MKREGNVVREMRMRKRKEEGTGERKEGVNKETKGGGREGKKGK